MYREMAHKNVHYYYYYYDDSPPRPHGVTHLPALPTAVVGAQPAGQVALLVDAQLAGEGEAPAALVAAVGLGVLVHRLVPLEVADLGEALATRLEHR